MAQQNKKITNVDAKVKQYLYTTLLVFVLRIPKMYTIMLTETFIFALLNYQHRSLLVGE